MRVVFSSISKHTDGQWPVGISKGVRVAMCLVLLQNASLWSQNGLDDTKRIFYSSLGKHVSEWSQVNPRDSWTRFSDCPIRNSPHFHTTWRHKHLRWCCDYETWLYVQNSEVLCDMASQLFEMTLSVLRWRDLCVKLRHSFVRTTWLCVSLRDVLIGQNKNNGNTLEAPRKPYRVLQPIT